MTFVVLVALLAFSFFARQKQSREIASALQWVWHAKMYAKRVRVAELEAGWLRALVDAYRALKAFDSRAAGDQLREFEAERPDLSSIVHEVVQDTEDAPEPAGSRPRRGRTSLFSRGDRRLFRYLGPQERSLLA